MADWAKIKAEYIRGGTSTRKLAKKYGIPYSTLRDRCQREGWVAKTERTRCKTNERIVEACAEEGAEYAIRIYKTADTILDAMLRILTKTDLAPQEIKSLTSALRDIATVKGLQTELDRAEQEARIAKLRRDVERDAANNEPIELIIRGMTDDETAQILAEEQFKRFGA